MPNYHAAAIQSPSRFKDGTERAEDTKTPGVRYITGEVKDKKAREPQAYRFARDTFTADQAQAWLTEHKISVQAFTAAEPAAQLSRASAIELERSHTFRKDTLRTGRFKTASGGILEVTPEKLAEIAGTFDSMRKNGVKVPVYGTTHKQAYGDVHGKPERVAENCIGYVEAAIKDGDQLDMIYDFNDTEAIKIAERVQQVSACIEPSFRDGEDREYQNAITHVLLTPEPVVPGQGEFKEVACFSRVDESTALARGDGQGRMGGPQAAGPGGKCVCPKCGATTEHETGTPCTDIKCPKCGAEMARPPDDNVANLSTVGGALETEQENEMDLKELAKELGLAEDADEKACIAAITSLKARPEPPQQLARESVDGLAEATGSKIDVLVAQSKITAARADKLKALLIGPDDKRNVYALSCALSGGDQSLASAVIAILSEDDKPVKSGTATGAQLPEGTAALSRDTDAEAPEVPAKRRETTKDEMAATASKV